MQMILYSTFLIHAFVFLSVAAYRINVYWRDFSPYDIPCDAVQSYEGKYIGQVVHKGNLLPTTIYPYRSIPAVTVFEGRLDIMENIKILSAPDDNRFYWEHVNFTRFDWGQMRNVVKGGHLNGQNLYIGRAYHECEWKVGPVIDIGKKDEKGLWVWNQSRENVRISAFFLLKYNSTTRENAC